jgi:short-subunit dehydrogenase
MRLDGAVVLITGGSSGIGAATARRLARSGAQLILTGRELIQLQDVAAETGAAWLLADLAEPEGPAKLAAAALDVAGRIDLLVLNAGIGWAGPTQDMTGAAAADLVQVNLLAPIELTRLLLPAMTKQGRGHIVFVSSIAGATAVRNEAVYAATKAGLSCFADSLRYELAGTGVGVSVVNPGVVNTAFFTSRGSKYDRARPAPIPADRVAGVLIRAVTSERAELFAPAWLRLPARLHGGAPGVFRWLASKFAYRSK